jgi:hypothetical protein
VLSTDDLPKFGPAGADPPPASNPVIISQDFFYAGVDKPSPQAVEAIRLILSGSTEVSSRFPEIVAWARKGAQQLQLLKARNMSTGQKVGVVVAGAGAVAAIVATGGAAGVAGVAAAGTALTGAGTIASGAAALRSRMVTKLSRAELRRVTYSQRWVRDPVMQIPPGGKRTFSSSRTSGISTAKSRDLSLALGFSHKGRVDIGTQLSKRLSTTVTVSKELAHTSGYEFSNSRSGYYQRVACWYVQHEFAVDALMASSTNAPSPAAQAQGLQWISRESASFTDPYAGQATYHDVRA